MVALVLAVVLGLARAAETGSFVSPSDASSWFDRANLVAQTLLPGTPSGEQLGLYDNSTGLWKNQLGWHHGYTLKVLANFAKCARSRGKEPKTVAAVEAVIAKAWAHVGLYAFGDKYDDLMYYASVWLNAYDFTGNATYLDAARDLFWNQVVNGSNWTVSAGKPVRPDAIWRGPHGPCGGGALWDKTSGYIAAIANEWLIYHLAQPKLLAGHDKDATEWGGTAIRWFKQSGFINNDSLINDGLSPMPAVVGVKCTNDGHTTWTYNQGVILAGLANYASMLKDMPPGDLTPKSLLDGATAIARATTKLLVINASVRDPTDPAAKNVSVLHEIGCATAKACVGNNEVFKGMFVQYLTTLIAALEKTSDAEAKGAAAVFRSFLQNNALSLWQHANANQGKASAPPYFGLLWEGPTASDGGNFYETVSTQSVALDLFTSTACVQDASAGAGDSEGIPVLV